MLKFFPLFIVFLCTTALSSWKLQGSQDFNVSEYVVQGHELHELRHAGLNRTVRSESEAKGDDKDEHYKKYQRIYESKKSKGGGKGAYGGANVPHHGKEKNAAPSSVVTPPCFLLTVTLLVIFTVMLSYHFQL